MTHLSGEKLYSQGMLRVFLEFHFGALRNNEAESVFDNREIDCFRRGNFSVNTDRHWRVELHTEMGKLTVPYVLHRVRVLQKRSRLVGFNKADKAES